jgi:hypothetical protein
MLCPAASLIEGACEANGLAGVARRISEAGGDSRMRVFNFGVTVVALIVLTILIGWLSTTWLAFEKEPRPHFVMKTILVFLFSRSA